jgi:hypothetical protein
MQLSHQKKNKEVKSDIQLFSRLMLPVSSHPKKALEIASMRNFLSLNFSQRFSGEELMKKKLMRSHL